ncbi:S8 family peptidase [Actinoalloteichus hymeniacidonis]|uniref:Subtilase family protease n=1 Tax=Actinoalloteichus hymeniacidonis TaxID=340345 RepID=A0AAC9MXF0_9PSEU|nr:S8 family serine peptidase [Actinoalloteichus hymeniacidonis]AOS62249.1 subtilase family protease [Actinoalloteichus hymeniacidonis]MBB5909725.1 subtilisin family serine protease [Actinoalloteichus hymeniacidonis]
MITLITGDQVRVTQSDGGGHSVAVVPAAGRENIRFHRASTEDSISVIPADALPLVQSGRLDTRLFDVLGLIEQGFADSGPLPLIFAGDSSAPSIQSTLAAPLADVGAEVVRELPSINGIAVEPGADDSAEVWSVLGAEHNTFSAGVDRVWLNGRAQLLDEESNAQIGAPEAWEAGFTGEGATVAVLDSGYDAEHPDLVDVVVDAEDFTGSDTGADDGHGHGTHVASTVAGSGAASDGAHAGVAPGADVIVGKVCGPEGDCQEDEIIAGMEWAAEQDADVANLSLGIGPTDGTDPLSLAVNTLTEQSGTLYVISAGNFRADESVSSPAAADAALAVASVTKNDELSDFSSRGPRIGDKALKPDIAAPGSDIIAAKAGGSGDEAYVSMSGTSMASPHVAGAAAILAAQNPDWQADELKAVLSASSVPLEGLSVTAQGAGRLDVAAAVEAEVYTSPASVSYGLFQYPHDQEPVTEELTYHNTGDTDLVLDLAFEPIGGDGTPAPSGLFDLGADQVTVPAGGEAIVELTVDPSVNDQLGFVGGSVLASSADGSTTVSTPAGVFLEPESYDLTIEATTHSGAVAENPYIGAVNRETGEVFYVEQAADGSLQTRLPVGRYDVLALLSEYGEGEDSVGGTETVGAELDVEVGEDTTISFDGTQGEPVSVEVDREATVQGAALELALPSFEIGTSQYGDGFQNFAIPTGDVDPNGLRLVYRPVLASPESADEPYSYDLVLEKSGIPGQPSFTVADEELAAVSTRYHAQGVEKTATRTAMGVLPDDLGGFGIGLPVELPSQRLHLFTSGDISWTEYLSLSDGTTAEEIMHQNTYEVGEHTATWNRAPLGISVGTETSPSGQRSGDELYLTPGYFAPGDALVHTLYGAEPEIVGTGTLSVNGETIATAPLTGFEVFPVPGGENVFTYEATATRSVPWSVLGTEQNATWTFTSDTVDGGLSEALPLLGIQFEGEVDDLGRAPAGVEYPLDLRVDRTSDDIEVSEVGLEVSYDDGASWTTVEPSRTDEGWTASLTHPEGDGFVSLRASAVDSAGNSVEQTTLRAYQITAG